jgi:hypothetical protein
MRREIDATLLLFSEAELPPGKPAAKPVAQRGRRTSSRAHSYTHPHPSPPPAGGGEFKAVEILPQTPARPEIESARYWAEKMRLAGSAERKAECHEKMMLSLMAVG